MTNEQSILLSVLRDAVHGAVTERFDADWDGLYQLAQRHQVTGLVYSQCASFCPDERFSRAYYRAIFRHSTLFAEYEEIAAELRARGIDFFLVKGFEVSKYYPIPELRTMGDLDLIVPDREGAAAVLEERGYRSDNRLPDHEWAYFGRLTELELHSRLAYEEPINTPEILRFFNRWEPYISDGAADVSFHFLYLLLHLRKHFMVSGVGIRQFLDIAMTIRYCDALNWPWIRAQLAELKLIDYAETVFALLECWFGVAAPIAYPRLEQAFIEEATQKIMKNGVFGFDDPDNRKNHQINTIRSSGRLGRAWNTFRGAVFPSYKSLIDAEQYAFLAGRRWLLPVAWVYRFFYCIFHRKVRAGVTGAKNSRVDQAAYEKRVSELEKWGLKRRTGSFRQKHSRKK